LQHLPRAATLSSAAIWAYIYRLSRLNWLPIPYSDVVTSSSNYDLQKFVDAQADTFDAAVRELSSGKKQSHWMWFMFPQHELLGRSVMAKRYGLSSIEEARAYLSHPVLGPRLLHLAELALSAKGRSAYEILGTPDDLKLRSSMTLFAEAAAPDNGPFLAVLARFWKGQRDTRTLELLRNGRC